MSTVTRFPFRPLAAALAVALLGLGLSACQRGAEAPPAAQSPQAAAPPAGNTKPSMTVTVTRAGRESLALGGLPLGLAHGVKLLRPVAAGQAVSWDDVAFDADATAVRFRREMERVFAA